MAGYDVIQLGDLAAGSTLNRIHIPDNPWPRTPQKIRKLPLCGAVKRRTSFPPWGNPWVTALVYAAGIAGSPAMLGIGSVSAMSAALCGVPSRFSKFIMTVLPGGTTSVAAPLV